MVATVAAIVMAGLAVAEPAIVEAPFENINTVAFTVGGTVVAAVGFVTMLRYSVPPVARVLALGLPFVAVSWWLLSPFFVDNAVDDDFATSIAEASAATSPTAPPSATHLTTGSTDRRAVTAAPAPASGPELLGAGKFEGLAGHEGTGDAGFFSYNDGRTVLRLENLDIQNGPDLRLYVVPGRGQTDPTDDSLYLGELRGNVGDQTYDVPADFPIDAGEWTVLVWCEAFKVEFVGATVTVA